MGDQRVGFAMGSLRAWVAGFAVASLASAGCGAPEPSSGDANAVESAVSNAPPPVCRVGAEHNGHHHDHDGDDNEPPAAGGHARNRVRVIAHCNGIDDTAQLQAAVGDADEVRLPVGTCAASGLVAKRKPLKLTGAGKGRSILKYVPRAGDSCMLFISGGHTVLTDLTFDGSRDAGANVAGVLSRSKTTVGPVFVTRVGFRNIAAQALIVSGNGGPGTVNGVVDDGDAVGAKPVSVFENEVTTSGGGLFVVTSSIPNISAVRVHDNDISVDSDAALAVRGLTDAQVFHNKTRGGVWGLLFDSGGSGIAITGNDIKGCSQDGIELGGGALNVGSGVLIAGNRVDGCNAGVTVAHMTAGRFDTVTIAGNELINNKQAGVVVTAGRQILVAHNRLIGNGLAGMGIFTAPPIACGPRCTAIDDLTIVGNLFRAAGTTAVAGLLVSNADAQNVRVIGNDLRFDIPTPPYQPVDLLAPPAAGQLTFANNLGYPTPAPAP